MPNLKEKLKRAKKPVKREGPLWKGPEVDGITQGLISRYLVCKERFRIHVIEGWGVDEGFSAARDYGSMWHACEESLAAYSGKVNEDTWLRALREECGKLSKQYPTEGPQILKWFNMCLNQFPVYVDWWSKHPDVKHRVPLLQEQVFEVPYTLPFGRVVKLKGKWDSVDLIDKGKDAGIYLQENKSKGRIDEEYLRRQLTFDLQTMVYLIAYQVFSDKDIKGVRYNVIRRPLSGKGPTKQLKNVNTGKRGLQGQKLEPREETIKELGERVAEECKREPKEWFMRWKVEITPEDIQNFKDQFLDPCLEEMCDWYEYQTTGLRASSCVHHYRLPYGIYNNILEGRNSDIEEYLLSGSTTGLTRLNRLFPELE